MQHRAVIALYTLLCMLKASVLGGLRLLANKNYVKSNYAHNKSNSQLLISHKKVGPCVHQVGQADNGSDQKVLQRYPDYMRDLVSMTATTATRSGLRSATGLLYRKPRIRTKFGERAFSFSGPAAWNSLPTYLQTTTDTNTFKHLLKTYLFATAY
jgi:hypothetical protein